MGHLPGDARPKAMCASLASARMKSLACVGSERMLEIFWSRDFIKLNHRDTEAQRGENTSFVFSVSLCLCGCLYLICAYVASSCLAPAWSIDVSRGQSSISNR